MFDLIVGILNIIISISYLISGIRITIAYRSADDPTFLGIGLCWIIVASPWYSASISFILALINGTGLSFPTYATIGTIAYPLGSILWLYSWTKLIGLKEKWSKIIIGIALIIAIIFWGIFIYFLIVNPSFLGSLNGISDASYSIFVSGYQMLLLIMLLTTTILFCKEALQSSLWKIQLKAKLLLISIILFAIGALLDIFSAVTIAGIPIALLFAMISLMTSSFLLYLGFLLPESIENYFKKFKK